MTLADLENEILSTLQQSELVNFGNAPNWATVQNPEFNQATVDHFINRAYLKVMRDISDIDVSNYEVIITSTANTTFYTLPPPVTSGNPNPPISELRRLFYKPVGMNFTLEFEPGIRMVPWKEFQRYTAAGYWNSASGNYPAYCSVTPDRGNLAFFPGTADNGDTITLWYSPIPTAGTLVPTLAQPTDTPAMPDDFHDLIPLYALAKLWPKARALAASQNYLQQYYDQLEKIRGMWSKRSSGDKMRLTDAATDKRTAGPYGWP